MRAAVVVPGWVRRYQREWLRWDLLAGVTVTAYLVPQVMAYAEVAGLPPATGLWAAVGAMVGYALIGSSHVLSVGPESTTALMTATALASAPAVAADPAVFAATLAILVAVVCVLGRVAHLGALASLLSRPVLVGYMAGIAGIMVVSQLGKLLGIAVSADGFFPELAFLVRHLGDLHVPSAVLGLATLLAMLAGALLWRHGPVVLLAVLGGTLVAWLLDLGDHGVQLVGHVPATLPGLAVPDLDADALRDLWVPALGVAFVGFTDNVLTARAFAGRDAPQVDAERELLALGAANVGSSLMHGFPVSSSGSRTAIADGVGARSQLAALVTVAATLLVVLVASPVLEAIPLPVLGAVVVYAAIRLVEVSELVRFARFRTSELVLAVATTVGVLVFGVLLGILVAIGLSVSDLLRRVARPHDAVEGLVPGVAGMHDVDDYPSAQRVPGLLVYRYDSPLFFANADDFRRRVLAAVDHSPDPVQWVLLNTEAVVEVDITATDVLEDVRRRLADRGIVLALARLKQDLRDVLAPTGLLDRIGEEHLFVTLPTAVEAFRAWQAGAGGTGG
ncbi:MAG TPA: SulP family inorganic anion transporter [Nocardioides sp.]|nr:SulP family inorganic anion transporter [Nocardioides sp.]